MTAGGVTHSTHSGTVGVYASPAVSHVCTCERDQFFQCPDTGDVSCLACGRPPRDAAPSSSACVVARAAVKPARGRNRPGLEAT